MSEQYRDHWRRYVITSVTLIFAALSIYRLYSPASGQQQILALVLGTTTVLFLLLESTSLDMLRQMRRERRYLDSYTALVTTLITGIMIVILTYLLAYGLVVAAYTVRHSNLLAQLFFEVIQQIRLFESVHPFVFATFYIVAATMVTIGVLIIYPLIPVRNQLVATIIAFLASWSYTLSLAYLALPIIHPLTIESMVIDAALIVVWAVLFNHMYDKPVLPNPFLKKFEKKAS